MSHSSRWWPSKWWINNSWWIVTSVCPTLRRSSNQLNGKSINSAFSYLTVVRLISKISSTLIWARLIWFRARLIWFRALTWRSLSKLKILALLCLIFAIASLKPTFNRILILMVRLRKWKSSICKAKTNLSNVSRNDTIKILLRNPKCKTIRRNKGHLHSQIDWNKISAPILEMLIFSLIDLSELNILDKGCLVDAENCFTIFTWYTSSSKLKNLEQNLWWFCSFNQHFNWTPF